MKPFYLKLLSIVLISFLGYIVYSNTFSCSFHFDDLPFIIQNSAIRDISNWHQIWHYYHGRFFVFLSLALNYHFNGLNVFGYHVFNLIIHLLTAVLVWWLVLLTLSTPAFKEEKITQHAYLIALFAGLVFVSHPIQIEAVTYIWQRAASMVALFYLASMCFYAKARLCLMDSRFRGNDINYGVIPVQVGIHFKIYYILSLISAVVAMFTKENAITLPLVILFYEYTFLKSKRSFEWSSFRTLIVTWKYVLPFLLTLFIIPITVLLFKSQVFQKLLGELRITGGVMTPMHYFLTQFRVMFTYIRLLFLPFNQNLDYDYPIYNNIFEPPVLISFLFLISIFYGAKCLYSKYKLLSFSIFWFFLALIIPESSFCVMGTVLFEHRLYLPMAGYSIFLVSGVYYLWGRNSVKTMIIILSLIVACNSVLAYQRNKVWKDEFTLWNDAVEKSPSKARPYNNRGLGFYKRGLLGQAMTDLNKAIVLDPQYPEPYVNRGLIFEKLGSMNQALIEYNNAILLFPKCDHAYYNRGLAYVKLSNFVQANLDFTKVIELNPHFEGIYYDRAFTYFRLKEYNKTWEDIKRSEELGFVIDPKFLEVLKRVSGKD